MQIKRPRVLVVDDDGAFASALAEALVTAGFDAEAQGDPARVLALVSSGTYEAVLVDLIMPQISGTDLAGKISLASPDTQVVILTGHADVDSAIESMRQGAFFYMRKDRLEIPDLTQTLRQAAARCWLTQENRELVQHLEQSRDLLTTLNELSASLAAEADPQRLLSTLAEAAQRLTRAHAARALLLRPTHGEGYVVNAAAGDQAEILLGARLRPGEGLAVMVVEQRKPLALTNPSEHPLFSTRSDALTTDRPGFVCAPLRHGLAFGVLTVAGARDADFRAEQVQLVDRLATHAAVALDNSLQRERGLNFFTHVSDMLVTLLDGVDVSYSGHSRSVATLADALTRRLGLAETERRTIHFGALLHDIGKMRVGLDVLGSRTVLTAAQRSAVREHPALGVEILRPITVWEDVLPIVQCHHEHWDGNGYPHGLAGQAIPLGARVVALAEVFDAMRRGVPRAAARTVEEALAEIGGHAGTQFDPTLAHLFVAELKERGSQILG